MATETATTTGETPDQKTVDAKILSDLDLVKEKMDLCESMLRPGDGSPAPSLKTNEALLGVIGFLEACAPRMVELVEAGSQGALSESVLMECLNVNDRLLKILSDIDTYAFTETPASTTAASAPKTEDKVEDLLLDTPNANPPPAPSQGGKTTGQEDPFGNEVHVLAPTPMGGPISADSTLPGGGDGKISVSNVGKAPAQTGTPGDAFDSFLADRTAS
mmetsp:Transcript_13762/g.32008  ORF Transcript_13762/g.32008 Transcript_13762/m.32008 type:complete len:218 (-) Transcript_13762:829-1482(-)